MTSVSQFNIHIIYLIFFREYRDKGNKAYQRKQNYEAIKLYTESLQYAESGSNSETLALAFANRSAVLLAQGKDKDVEAALR
jgi:hypothetical protein